MKKLGAMLHDAGIIDEIQLVRALSHQRKWRCKLGKSLIELGFVNDETIAKIVSQQLNLLYLEIEPNNAPKELIEAIPRQMAEEKTFFPIGYATQHGVKKTVIAFADPAESEVIDAISRKIGSPIFPVIARESLIKNAIYSWDKYKTSNRLGGVPVNLPMIEERPEEEIQNLAEADIVGETEAPQQKPLAAAFSPSPASTPTYIPGPANTSQSDLPADIFLGASQSDFETMAQEEILSVSDLPSLDSDGGSPPMNTLENIEDWNRDDSETVPPHSDQSSDSDEPEITHSQPWEHAMPDQHAKDLAQENLRPSSPAKSEPSLIAESQTHQADEWKQAIQNRPPNEETIFQQTPAYETPQPPQENQDDAQDDEEPESLPIDAMSEVGDLEEPLEPPAMPEPPVMQENNEEQSGFAAREPDQSPSYAEQEEAQAPSSEPSVWEPGPELAAPAADEAPPDLNTLPPSTDSVWEPGPELAAPAADEAPPDLNTLPSSTDSVWEPGPELAAPVTDEAPPDLNTLPSSTASAWEPEPELAAPAADEAPPDLNTLPSSTASVWEPGPELAEEHEPKRVEDQTIFETPPTDNIQAMSDELPPDDAPESAGPEPQPDAQPAEANEPETQTNREIESSYVLKIVLKEIRSLREEVTQLSFLIEALVNKIGK